MRLDGHVGIEIHETTARADLLGGFHSDDGLFDVYVDTVGTLMSPFTSFKTTKRDIYSSARARALPGTAPGREEVVLVNSSGQVMEGSITNVAVKIGDSWITPGLSTGCLCGVTRSYLLKRNLIQEGDVPVSELRAGTEVLLFNGVMGVVRGRVREGEK